MSSSSSKFGASPPAVDSKQLESNQLSSVEDSADHLLETLGYTPELSRNRSTAQVAFMSFVLASIPYGLATTLYYPLLGGGPVDIIWGWVLVSLIIICVAASLGEITSVYPTAGGISRQFQSLLSLARFGSCDTLCAFVASSPTTAKCNKHSANLCRFLQVSTIKPLCWLLPSGGALQAGSPVGSSSLAILQSPWPSTLAPPYSSFRASMCLRRSLVSEFLLVKHGRFSSSSWL